MAEAELKYFAKTGRMTVEDEGITVAIPTVQSLARALAHQDLGITRISTDSFGGNVAAGLLTHLEPGQVSHAYMKGKPNVSDFSLPRFVWRMMVRENLINNPRTEKASEDPWKLTSEIQQHVRSVLGKIYYEDAPNFRRDASKKQLLAYANGLRIAQPSNRNLSPAYDIVVAKTRNPNLALTLDFPDSDLLYRGIPDITNFMKNIVWHPGVDRQGSRLPLAIISRGTHGGHAYEPRRRIAAEHFAFNRK